MEKTERIILERQFHWGDRSVVAQLWNIAFCLNNDLFTTGYIGQCKWFREYTVWCHIDDGLWIRTENRTVFSEKLFLAGTVLNKSCRNDSWFTTGSHPGHFSILLFLLVVLIVLLVISSASMYVSARLCVSGGIVKEGHSHVGGFSATIINH